MSSGHEKVVKMVLEHGNINSGKPDNIETPLLCAAENGYEGAKILLEPSEVYPNKPDYDSGTPIG